MRHPANPRLDTYFEAYKLLPIHHQNNVSMSEDSGQDIYHAVRKRAARKINVYRRLYQYILTVFMRLGLLVVMWAAPV